MQTHGNNIRLIHSSKSILKLKERKTVANTQGDIWNTTATEISYSNYIHQINIKDTFDST